MENFDYNLLYKTLTLGFFILGPVLPAYLLYKIAPQDKILGKGNFAGFNINATGATATFIILFAALYPKIDTVFTSIDAYQQMQNERVNLPWKVYFKVQLMNDTSAISTLDYEKYIKQDSIMSSPRPMRFDYQTQTLSFYIDNDVLQQSEGQVAGTLVLRNGFGTCNFIIDKNCRNLKNRTITITKKFYKAHTNDYASLKSVRDTGVRHFKMANNIMPPAVTNP
ncbi:hypothetical protein SNE25_14265 [Mucilaginibacter sabulilitoris]|uniref:Uncharacterized protein n=1 Tax=Mucilaginibacter sabulilitoris TaxID=1173583 RepID=A0ABZ0TZZ7_9SPHI|nr:hypothetical protein [Mucilaginibacter sabulilitoris]WPU96685.1 hypothetical protein SNE25_14265 [Mucilaginibacter sabulilitoris]